MAISDRKERERQEMRKLIISAALKMFVEEGYEKTSIRKIADKIEYSPATLYLYYKDKDELLYEVQREAFSQLYETFLAHATARHPMERLEQLARLYIKFAAEHPDLYDLMFILRSPMKAVEDEEKEWENGLACFNYLQTCINECIEQGLIRFTNPPVAGLTLWSMVHGVVSLNIRCRFKILRLENETQVTAIIDASVDQFLTLIKT
ncbi:TetR/AcrR family transcriptional regulator [Chitinophaga pendula]|uniref:TetR/AcrR family transcriptional regulator n=1 Tax=Chitinophaga TaxID=79328 RepID=UPI000BAFFB10|nr:MULTISPECIES: TetR/AcrR family transcriptional regulator [Chitinophaga]ASZ13390.1 TetR family transcriptional regulator [Chitinophaga sp. MD30]UCJ08986.1 TetR/AcrR family transcriptional regulator [Chitinophaga pendula]